MTSATFSISSLPWMSSTNLPTSGRGRLSTQKWCRSSSARSAVVLPAPESPETTTILTLAPWRPSSCGVSLHLVGRVLPRPDLGDRTIEPFLEHLGRVVSLVLEQLVARGHLDECADVPARAHRDLEQGHLHVED